MIGEWRLTRFRSLICRYAPWCGTADKLTLPIAKSRELPTGDLFCCAVVLLFLLAGYQLKIECG